MVIDFDDDPENWPVLKQEDYISFKMVHAVQTSTPELAAILSQWNPNVKAFPNMLEKLLMVNQDKSTSGRPGLKMFFGALNREEDWAPLIDDLNHVLRDDPEFWSASVSPATEAAS